MSKKKYAFLVSLIFLAGLALWMMSWGAPDRVVYKIWQDQPLHLTIFEPSRAHRGTAPSAIVMFHGGGWRWGSYLEMAGYADHFTKKGFLSIFVEYRLEGIHQTTPVDAMDDARDAYRFIMSDLRENVAFDPRRVVLFGGSAGGHLAYFAAYHNLKQIAQKPAGLIMVSTPVDTSPAGFGADKFGPRWPQGSALLNYHPDMPAIFMMHSRTDHLVPFGGAQKFAEMVKRRGGEIDTRWLSKEGHGFYVWDNVHRIPQARLDDIDHFIQTRLSDIQDTQVP